jgi:hypothetical protein
MLRACHQMDLLTGNLNLRGYFFIKYKICIIEVENQTSTS